jgi:uncharacterized protein (TIGR02001 family)
MKKCNLLLVSTLMMSSTMALADIEFSGFINATNNFMYRGISLTRNSAAIQGQVSAKDDSGLYATLWGSNTKLGTTPERDGPGLETTFSVGYSNKIIEDLSFDVGYMRTFYPGTKTVDGNRYDFNDFYGSLTYKGLTAGISYSDDFFGETGSGIYSYVSYKAPIIEKLSILATVGHMRNSSREFLGLFGVDKSNWTHYVLGLSYPLPRDFEISGAYHGTDRNGTDAFDVTGYGTNRFVFNLTKNF